MDRRNFLLGVGASTIAVFIHPDLEADIGAEPRKALQLDPRLQVLGVAIQAPNSHNTQPWQIELLSGLRMRLYVDRNRLLPASDPWARQTTISQGTFLELLDIAVRQMGYKAKMRFYPEGEPSPHLVDSKPVAEIELVKHADAQPDPLFAAIATRQSNKRCYDPARSVAESELTALETSASPTDAEQWMEWRWVSSTSERKAIAEICRQAMAVEVADRQRNLETAQWFRFSERELRARRDGFGCAQNGMDGAERWFAETFVLSRARAANPNGSFAQGAIQQAARRAGSAAVFGALVTKQNSRFAQLRAGRAYVCMHLAACTRGLAMHPMSQALEEYGAMANLQKRLKLILGVEETDTVQMLFRLGYARPVPRPPRREVTDLIRQAETAYGA
jgi:hypothetical protein